MRTVSSGNKLNVEMLKYNHNLLENAINLVKHKYINIQNVSNAYSLQRKWRFKTTRFDEEIEFFLFKNYEIIC